MARYTVGVIRDFVAQHYLIGGDWGRENQLHSHHYKLEVIFAGDELDQHGYLLDIAVVKPAPGGAGRALPRQDPERPARDRRH